MDTLKPCPFCDKPPTSWDDDGVTMVMCANTNCEMTEIEAMSATAWNTRPGDDAHHTLLGDALFALENVGVEPDLCERIREVLRDGENPNIERGNTLDEMPF